MYDYRALTDDEANLVLTAIEYGHPPDAVIEAALDVLLEGWTVSPAHQALLRACRALAKRAAGDQAIA